MATTNELLDLAVSCHRSGNLQQSEALCRQILQADPGHAAARHVLGLLAHQAGDHAGAIALIRQAIALNPAHVECHFNLGIIFTKLGQRAEAIECYRQALRLHPNHAMAQNNLGNLLREQGQLEEATQCYREAVRISPHSAAAAFNLANALGILGQNAEAALYYRQVIANDPENVAAHNNLGVIYKNQGQLEEAAQCYRQALRLNPQHAGAHNNLGLVLVEQQQLSEGIECYRQALRFDPLLADAHFNLGNALGAQGRMAEAAECYRQALKINPQLAGAHNYLGIALMEQGQLAEAARCYRQALRLDPDHALVHQNLSVALMHMGLLPEAVEHNERGLRLQPGHGPGLWQRSVLRLLKGEYETGWRDYEQRWTLPDKVLPSFQRPRWDGSALAGKTILVYAEQGLGDTIQFVRYLPMVKERGGTVLFQCPRALLGLCNGIRGVDQLVPVGMALPSYDVQVALLSLPGIFGTTLSTIPATAPYLYADPHLAEYWRTEMEPLAGFKVGIAWQGNPKNSVDRFRSLALTRFRPLARVRGVHLVSLQVGPGTDQLAAASFPVTDLGSKLDPGSLGDLAAVMANLDLIVSVETAVAHLAGALAAPVWTLLPLVPDWRWLLDRADSPWYPTMRLFRQSRQGDWDEVLERVQEALRLLIAGGPR
jgi:tetratricopeptide (TPR) repeat protein